MHARFGLLIARGGMWGSKRLLSEDWVRQLHTPIDIYKVYGFLWWLNTARDYYPSAPATSFFALGAGSNLIWIDQALDIVGVFPLDRAEQDRSAAGACDGRIQRLKRHKIAALFTFSNNL